MNPIVLLDRMNKDGVVEQLFSNRSTKDGVLICLRKLEKHSGKRVRSYKDLRNHLDAYDDVKVVIPAKLYDRLTDELVLRQILGVVPVNQIIAAPVLDLLGRVVCGMKDIEIGENTELDSDTVAEGIVEFVDTFFTK